jgi:thiol-disulfide isomerase/thioredoxin
MRIIAIALARFVSLIIVTAFAVQSSVPSGAAGAHETIAGASLPGFEAVSPPVPAPEIAFNDGAGVPLTLADFRGRVVLLNFWATWCAPCVREMPSLDRLQAALGGPDFEVVALSVDRGGISQVRPFFARLGIAHLKKYLDTTSRSISAFGLIGLPVTVLIDAEGMEVGRLNGPAEWDSEAAVALIRTYLGVSPTTSASLN